MQLAEEEGGGGGGGAGGEESPAVVVVGVKMDGESRELLTWALVKVARPGDRVIALHVLEEAASIGTASFLSLVKAFDSVIAVYEGFCHLKQVDLKLKVCRGPSVRKVLVQEANSHSSAKVIVGISKSNHTIRSPASVAKYCARNLSKSFWVFAIDNGKVIFERDAVTDVQRRRDNNWRKSYAHVLHWSMSRKISGKYNQRSHCCSQKCNIGCEKKTSDQNSANLAVEALGDSDTGVDNSMALVPFQPNDDVSSSNSAQGLKTGWMFLQRIFLRGQPIEESGGKKMSAPRVLRRSTTHSSAVVHPDQKQSCSAENHTCNLDGKNVAIVPVGEAAASPPSPCSSSKEFPEELKGLHEKYSSTCRLFNYEELLVATCNFIPENMVGKGGCSKVYRGCLPDGKELAVKLLKPFDGVVKDFVSEIDIITDLHHKNIVSLFGFCFESNNLILVYDFVHRGSLEENLHGNKKDLHAFGWRERYKVAVGVAEALDYMHNGCDQPVIHKDVKSSNILLSDDFEPQLSDFGMAIRVPDLSTQIISDNVAGTFGYLAPEYFMHGKVSDRIDVYAFGVVILELISGRRPIDGECPKGQESLVMWAKPILKAGKVSQLLDPSLGRDYDPEQIGRMVLAATLCIRRLSRFRPQISLVSMILKLLQGDEEVLEWARQQINSSEELDEMDGEDSPVSIQSHLNLAFQDLEDDSLSVSSTEQSMSSEDYLQSTWSRSSSFD
ncbi:protein kinase STUNTED-like isoform X2 [Syzygium oleosum]|uniref:protein kinase STUNTED-like isoform X2 n=1 Tax=Syzygium oleosum TaxID=219896 RepID=UPI0024BB8918|nr:protein kinase STUNTED-like isoform X2 [Syzygium oleosum]